MKEPKRQNNITASKIFLQVNAKEKQIKHSLIETFEQLLWKTIQHHADFLVI